MNVTEANEWIASHDRTGVSQRGYDLGGKSPTLVADFDVDPKLPGEDLDLTSASCVATVLSG